MGGGATGDRIVRVKRRWGGGPSGARPMSSEAFFSAVPAAVPMALGLAACQVASGAGRGVELSLQPPGAARGSGAAVVGVAIFAATGSAIASGLLHSVCRW